jgi:GC-rich sequence DNA-binding factor
MTPSTSPVIFKRAKAKTAQRTRHSLPDNDTETAATETEEGAPDTLATKLKNKAKKRPKSRLSFGADEDEVGVRNAH